MGACLSNHLESQRLSFPRQSSARRNHYWRRPCPPIEKNLAWTARHASYESKAPLDRFTAARERIGPLLGFRCSPGRGQHQTDLLTSKSPDRRIRITIMRTTLPIDDHILASAQALAQLARRAFPVFPIPPPPCPPHAPPPSSAPIPLPRPSRHRIWKSPATSSLPSNNDIGLSITGRQPTAALPSPTHLSPNPTGLRPALDPTGRSNRSASLR